MNYTSMELRNIAKSINSDGIVLTTGMETSEIRDYLLDHRILTSINGMLCDAELQQVRDYYYESKGLMPSNNFTSEDADYESSVSSSSSSTSGGSFGLIGSVIAAAVLAFIGFFKNENRRFIFPVASILMIIAKALECALSDASAFLEVTTFTVVAGIVSLIVAALVSHLFGEAYENFLRKNRGKEKKHFGSAYIPLMIALCVAIYMVYDFIEWGSEYQVYPSFIMLCIMLGFLLVSSIVNKKNSKISVILSTIGLSLMCFLDYDGLTFYDYECGDNAINAIRVFAFLTILFAVLYMVCAATSYAKAVGFIADVCIAALIATTIFTYALALVIVTPMVCGLYRTMYLRSGIIENERERQRDIEAGYIVA